MSCSVDGCTREVYAREWCNAHYLRWRDTGGLRPEVPVRERISPDAVCSVDGCSRPMRSRGWCEAHYLRWKHEGDVRAGIPIRGYNPGATCSFPGCCHKSRKRGFCEGHYTQWHTGQDLTPLGKKRRPKGTGGITAQGYWMVTVDGKQRFVHRLVMEQQLGRELLPGENVHHINGDKLNNHPDNLELWVTSQPSGQRPEDLLAYAYEIIERYGAA